MLDGRGERLQKYLSRAGIGSRRECERLISEGRVSIDGRVVTELGTRVQPEGEEQEVRLDGERVEPRSVRWIALYKPAGYLSTRKDDRGRPTVYALLPSELKHLFHVGRLDRLTEGLLMFTNDGEAANRLLHPSGELARRYEVEVDGRFGALEAKRLQRGVRLEDGLARAADVSFRTLPGRVTTVTLTLHEGRKREVRRMFEALELRVKRLVRTSFGSVTLEGLKPGAWRELGEQEIEILGTKVGLEE